VRDIFALRLYTRVARLGNFSAAARECDLSQLMNSQEAELAMPLNQFIAAAIKVLGTDANEIVIEAAKTMRNNAGPAEHGFVNDFNTHMLALFSAQAAAN
jgi:hypothetical protein